MSISTYYRLGPRSTLSVGDLFRATARSYWRTVDGRKIVLAHHGPLKLVDVIRRGARLWLVGVGAYGVELVYMGPAYTSPRMPELRHLPARIRRVRPGYGQPGSGQRRRRKP